MRLNIFRIPPELVKPAKAKLKAVGMTKLGSSSQSGWKGSFFYSDGNPGADIPWAKHFRDFFTEHPIPRNQNHFAAYIFTKGDNCYALSYGKVHFYLRPYCDYDFGVELAKRIANEDDTRQTASRRYTGRRRKTIRSYANNTQLSVESGESVDFIQASIITERTAIFGKSAKFGTSVQLSPDIEPDKVGKFLSKLNRVLKKDARFALPRTVTLTNDEEIERFDRLLLDELSSEVGSTEFTHNLYDLYGVDFVFESAGSYVLKWGRRSKDLETLTIKELKEFVAAERIPRERVLDIKIVFHQEDGPTYHRGLKEVVDFIPDGDRVILSDGKWMRFNQDYLDFLDDFIREIVVEEAEPELRNTYLTETSFNVSPEVASAGYEIADKDFSIFKTKSSTPVEAWDLKRGNTVYAVKFGTAQKLSYSCSQATATLELMRNRAQVKEIPHFERYCLWFGYRAKTLPVNIADTGSIILKQRIEAWARKCAELGITPVVKLTHKLRQGIDDASEKIEV